MGTITLGTGTPININDAIYTYNGSYSGNLKNIVAFDYFDDDFGVGDCIYFLTNYPPKYLRFNVGTAMAANSYTLVWEYMRYELGLSWINITSQITDGTNNFTTLGVNDIDFTNAKFWNGGRYNVNGNGGNFVLRCRVTAVDTPTEGGANITDTVKFEERKILINGFASGSPTTFWDIYDYLVNTAGSTICDYHDNSTSSDTNFDAYYFIPYPIHSVDSYSYIKTKNEKVIVGCGDSSCNFSANLLMGEVTADNFTYNGSSIMFPGYQWWGGAYLRAGSKIYGSKVNVGAFTNPDTGFDGSTLIRLFTYSGGIFRDSFFRCNDFYYSGGTWNNCTIDGYLLFYSSIGDFTNHTFFSSRTQSMWLCCYAHVSALLKNSTIQSSAAGNPTTSWAYHYQTASPDNLRHYFQDCTPKCPDQDGDPPMYTRAAGKAEGGWYGYETRTIGFQVVNEDGTKLPGVKLSAKQKDHVVGTWSDTTFIEANDKTPDTSGTILTSDSDGNFDKAGDGILYAIKVQTYYYDATNSEGYPTHQEIVSKDERLTEFRFQLKGYETQIVSMNIGSEDGLGNLITPKVGTITMKRSPYKVKVGA